MTREVDPLKVAGLIPEDGDLLALRAIAEGTAHSVGEEFFSSLVRHLASALGVPYAFVAEFARVNTRVRTLAYWHRDRIAANVEFDLAGTPCEDVVRGHLCHHPIGVKDKFPLDRPLVQMGIESYLGVPLLDDAGNHLGHLAVFDERPMPSEPRRLFVFRIFASRAAAELERLRAERRLRDSEARYRDLYHEAPIAYVSTGTDGRFRSVNRSAAQLLGYTAEEMVGMPLTDILADTPAGKPKGLGIFQKFLRGEGADGEELELRHKDGRPVWVSLWMKPMRGDDGKVQASRSIWIDITARVLAEAERARLAQQNLYLQEEIKAAHNFEEIIGRSPALAAVLDHVRQVAPTDTTVLITGETGTGKELIARALHSSSRRKHKPLIKVNCAALPTGLVESELFGHEKGAFTGAIARRVGRFELADGGTLFLDEVGEIPPEVQVKLLRVLQEREFDRVGGTAPIKVDVRVLAATNRDLLQAVRDKTFREDLYYRLSVFPVRLPPLRERPEDIPLLAHFLVDKFAMRIGKRIEGISQATMQHLLDYAWPGNVRELENVLERAVILTRSSVLEIDASVLPGGPPREGEAPAEPGRRLGRSLALPGEPPAGGQAPTLEAVECEHIRAVLRQTNGVIDGPAGAARILGLHPNTLRSRMKKLGITRPGHDPS
ncbi:MAG: sigma 54-interacting transcriptional regulator [Planctomycetes bacterium]|nr:sigma 54-interacting transcriptional regulator [Planctomycetota bacterium]